MTIMLQKKLLIFKLFFENKIDGKHLKYGHFAMGEWRDYETSKTYEVLEPC